MRISERHDVDPGVGERGGRDEAHPGPSGGFARGPVLPIVDPLRRSLLDVLPERVPGRPGVLAEQLGDAGERVRIGHVVRAECGVMFESVEVAVDTPHCCDEQRAALL